MLIDVEYTAAAHARDDAMVATLLGNDPTPCAQCTRIGDRHLLLAPGAEAKVRTALRKLGYALGPGTDSTRRASPASCLAAIGGR
jgi:hypothetical protein